MRSIDDVALQEPDRAAVRAACRVLQSRFPLKQVILYGSKARGEADPDSDIDLLVITPEPLPWRERKALIDALFDVELAHDTLISVLVVSEAEWAGGLFTGFPIYRDIVRDGVLAA